RTSLDGSNDVVVYNRPAELVVTSTTPDLVATDPSELVVTKVVVYSCNPSLEASLETSLDGSNDVVVYNRPAELVVTSTTPDLVATDPSEFVVTKVVVYSCNPSLETSLETSLESLLETSLETSLDASLETLLEASLETSLDGSNDVVVYNRPAELVVTSTTPDLVVTDPSELVVTKVVVYSCNPSLETSLEALLETSLETSLEASSETSLEASLEASS
ncbi:hypothetical protein OXX80_014356, partial [Metschnikowia pulcherrima]